MQDNTVRDNSTGKQWFCRALQADGSISSGDFNTAEGINSSIASAVIAWVDLRTPDFENDYKLAAQVGFSEKLISALMSGYRNMYEDFETEMGIKLSSIQINTGTPLEVKPNLTLVFLKKNLILTVHPMEIDRRWARLRHYADSVLKKLPAGFSPEDRLTTLLIRLIETNNDRNFEHLRQIEESGDELNKQLMDPKTPRELIGPRIYEMKHALIIYLDSLWESVDVIRDLRFGDADLVSDTPLLLDRIGVMAEDVNRQIGLAEHLSDVLSSGLEVLQSIYNNQLQVLNNKLAMVVAYLTIIGTALLVPNTLATVLGNSAFNMGSGDRGWYIIMLVVSTIAATMVSFWWVKKFGWVPKRADRPDDEADSSRRNK
jgi:magnesium transporter